jgi:outer membrane protein assembly factor BamA
VADIQVIGNQQVSDKTVLETMTLKPGDPFGEDARLESQQRINALGLFRRVSVDEAPRLPGETRAHVIVTVEEAPAHTISYGGGVDAGRLSRTTTEGTQEEYVAVSPRAFFAVQRRNLWGRNSSIDFFSRVALKPTSDPSDPTRDGHGYGFTEYRVVTAYREPRAFKTLADLTISVTFEQGLRPTFNFLHKNATAELTRHLTRRLSLSARYALDYSHLFDTRIAPEDQLTIDRAFSQVRLSLVSSSLVLDRRNDPVSPSHGTFSTADFEIAGRAIGSEIGYVKTFLQTSYFRALTDTRRFVFATRAELGLAQGFPRLGTVIDENGNEQTVVVEDLPASQRFFAGGSTTVRGFALDQLGVPGVLDENGLSNGGNGLLVFNAELRTLVGKLFGYNFGVVGFTDAGNVFQNAHDVALSQLRGSAGFGLRYDSPIGPVRLDYGWKFSRNTFQNGVRERGWEFHFNIGEAF